MTKKEELLTTDKIILLIVDDAGGRLRGKTLLQKRAYFLAKIMGLDLGYRPHYYGPYSSEIEEGLARSKSLGFIEERTLGFGLSDAIGFEVRRYDFELTDDGKNIISNLEEMYPKQCQKIRECLKQLADAGDNGDHVSLSVAAKAYYILTEKNSRMASDDIREAGSKLGWKIERDSLEKAISFLEKLDLLKLTK